MVIFVLYSDGVEDMVTFIAFVKIYSTNVKVAGLGERNFCPTKIPYGFYPLSRSRLYIPENFFMPNFFVLC
jgi:hypothetical protein